MVQPDHACRSALENNSYLIRYDQPLLKDQCGPWPAKPWEGGLLSQVVQRSLPSSPEALKNVGTSRRKEFTQKYMFS